MPNEEALQSLATQEPPFSVDGARNVILETIKRGEYDNFSSKASTDASKVNVVLRLYEAYGGHARAKIHIGSHIPITKAYVTNLLEDEIEEIHVEREASAKGGSEKKTLTLDFHGFEVKTVKLVIGPPPKAADEPA